MAVPTVKRGAVSTKSLDNVTYIFVLIGEMTSDLSYAAFHLADDLDTFGLQAPGRHDAHGNRRALATAPSGDSKKLPRKRSPWLPFSTSQQEQPPSVTTWELPPSLRPLMPPQWVYHKRGLNQLGQQSFNH
jgi:hypothetical protein